MTHFYFCIIIVSIISSSKETLTMKLFFFNKPLRRCASVSKDLDKFGIEGNKIMEKKKSDFFYKYNLKNDTFEKRTRSKSCECYLKY